MHANSLANRKNVRFMIPLVPQRCSTLSPRTSLPKRPRRGMIQQTERSVARNAEPLRQVEDCRESSPSRLIQKSVSPCETYTKLSRNGVCSSHGKNKHRD